MSGVTRLQLYLWGSSDSWPSNLLSICNVFSRPKPKNFFVNKKSFCNWIYWLVEWKYIVSENTYMCKTAPTLFFVYSIFIHVLHSSFPLLQTSYFTFSPSKKENLKLLFGSLTRALHFHWSLNQSWRHGYIARICVLRLMYPLSGENFENIFNRERYEEKSCMKTAETSNDLFRFCSVLFSFSESIYCEPGEVEENIIFIRSFRSVGLLDEIKLRK